MTARSTIALCLLVAAGAGCAARPVAPPSAVTLEPDAVLAAVQRREAAIHTLRARFAARVQRGDEVRHADGVLVVKKPDGFRVRLLSTFGLTVFDYVSWQDHARMLLPLEGKELEDSQIANQAGFSPADMREVFLRPDTILPRRCSTQSDGAEVVVKCRDAGDEMQRLQHLDAATLTLRQEITFAAGAPHLIMAFDDYRAVDAVTLPFAITLTYPQRGIQLSISVRSYEVNPALLDSLFDAGPHSGSGS